MTEATSPGLQSLHVREKHPDFLDLPWDRTLPSWGEATPRLVELPRGLSRHEVRFAAWDGRVYAFKQITAAGAEREYGRLLELETRGLPAVAPTGWAIFLPAEGEPLGMLITQFLEASLPYFALFQGRGLERYRERLLDAMAGLLVRLHLAGVYWGDCSLSNTLFRRDAGELGAYLVDAETVESHPSLSDGQRNQDLMIMEENVAGELIELSFQTELPSVLRDEEAPARIRRRYETLWAEVAREETVGPEEGWRIEERVRALNALGFSVQEIELVATGEGSRLSMRTAVTDRDYHRHRLHDLTGLVAEERQAQLLLNEIRELKAHLSAASGRSTPASVAAHRWLTERWEPALRALEKPIREGGDPVELYCQILEHKWFLSEQARRDVGLDAALEDYLARFPG